MNDLVYPDPALLAAVRVAMWEDKLPRLVLADWLDEHGDHERAEFVRHQCGFYGKPADSTGRQVELLQKNGRRWLPWQTVPPIDTAVFSGLDYYVQLLRQFHLGFVEETAVDTVGEWVGEEIECLACEDATVCWETNAVECSRCDGTGVDFIKGVGGQMVRMHPLNRVWVRTSNPARGENGGWYWDCCIAGGGSGLPPGVYERLPVFSELRRFGRPLPMRIGYENEDFANAELSEAMILYATEEL